MKKLLLLPVLFFIFNSAHAQNYVWAKSAGGTAEDFALDIAVDGSGNTYIIGYFEGTADFDPGPGTAILTVAGFNDIFFAKYDASGNYLWAKSIGSADYDAGLGIALDGSGNCYITGYFQWTADFDPGAGTAILTPTGGSGYDIFFAKYDTSGNYLWAKNVGGTNTDMSWDIAVDGSGNTYITGSFQSTADFDPGAGIANLTGNGLLQAIFFAKYDASGNYLWAKGIVGTGNNTGIGIAVDGSGITYITGSFQGTADFDPGAGTATLTSAGNSDIFFAKYDASGNYLWANRIGSTGNDFGNDIVLDGSGNTYITGGFQGTADFDPGAGTATLTSTGVEDIFFARYDASGNYLWANSIGSTSNDRGRGIALDGSGNTYITGSFQGTPDFDPGAGTAILTSTGVEDIFFAKYDVSGNYLWAQNIGSTAFEEARSIAVDGSGNTYITGGFSDTADFDPGAGTANLTSLGSLDIFFAKYDSLSIPTANNEIENFGNSILIFPNPAMRTISFNTNGYIGNLHLQVINMLGQKIISEDVSLNGEDMHTLDVSTLTPGIYKLILLNDLELNGGSFVKE